MSERKRILLLKFSKLPRAWRHRINNFWCVFESYALLDYCKAHMVQDEHGVWSSDNVYDWHTFKNYRIKALGEIIPWKAKVTAA